MTRQQVILVGVDGSNQSKRAVEWAVSLALQNGAMVHVICTYALASYSSAALDGGFTPTDDEALKKNAQQAVDEAVQIGREQGVDMSGSIEPGDPAGVLVETSREVDMIVVGSKGNGGLADRLLGTVSSALPAHARCPVVVVPRHTSGSPFTPVKRIVVGVDGPETASNALRAAVDQAQTWDCELTAVAAIPMASGTGMFAWLPATVDREALTESITEGLDSAINEALDGRKVAVYQHVLDGSPAALLTEFSTAVDLVVVGNRGKGGFQGLLLGSTSQTVLAHSTCPVMVVPSSNEPDEDDAPSWERK